MTNDNEPNLPTLAEAPRAYIKNRAARLARLVELNAPYFVLHQEFLLLQQAIVALQFREGDNPEGPPQ